MEDFENNLSIFKEILNALPNSIYLKDIQGHYLWLNQAAITQVKLKHLIPDSILGKTDFEVFPETYAIEYSKNDKKVIKTNQGISAEEDIALSDGEKLTQLSFKEPFYSGNPPKLIGLLGYTIDITELNQTKEQLLKEKNKAEAANTAKTAFLYNMRHDIRTPLTGIIGLSDALKTVKDLSKVNEYGHYLALSSRALLEFLNEVLEAIRLDSVELPIVVKPFNLKEIITKVLELNQPRALEKELKLTLDYDEAIPPFLMGDPMRIHRIVLELVTNALNFTEKGYVRVSTSLEKLENRDLVIKLMVEDSGIGLPEDMYQEIFTRFKRLTPSYTGIYKGVGLGLALIKQFITDLDAEIYVASELNKGSLFTCIIPLKKALLDKQISTKFIANQAIVETKIDSPELKAVDTRIHVAKAGSAIKQGIRILLVEDQPMPARMAEDILQGLGCQVDISRTGMDALEQVKKQAYDLIFMDIGLPDIDGLEVTRRIRLTEAEGIHVPIVALTAHADAANKAQSLEIGVDDICNKPLDETMAATVLQRYLSLASLSSLH